MSDRRASPCSGLPPSLQPPLPEIGATVLHLDYGRCRMGPPKRMTLDGVTLDTVELIFKGGETRHVPLSDACRIWSYGAHMPKKSLDPIDATDWPAAFARELVEMRAEANRLSKLYDARRSRRGTDVPLQDEAVETAGRDFDFDLTICQEAALSEILTDLRSPSPMNRVLIGDVGCGKTEVALRAALATALSGQAVRLAAPTRVLARQHAADFTARAKPFGLHVALYSGDATATEKADLRDRMMAGEIDILIGTHGVMRFDAGEFGLTIIDEEQKFGAKLKDKATPDATPGNVLRLSATPIPRTLAEARTGVADVSLIETYPTGRGQTQTHLARDSDKTLCEWIAAELDRDGQVILLCPRIRDLKVLRRRIKALFPNRSVGRIHGKRKAAQNRETLERFRTGGLDLLCATTMLETGINVSNANLMIVFQPQKLGLAQLHQLRGRVGRGQRDAQFVLMSDAAPKTRAFRKRMKILKRLQTRGDGLQLALADSLLRGTGRLGDDDQTGHASALGLEFFARLLDAPEDFTVPNIVGDRDWQFPVKGEAVDLEAVFRQTRAALDGENLNAPYPQLLNTTLRVGAQKVGIDGEEYVFVTKPVKRAPLDNPAAALI